MDLEILRHSVSHIMAAAVKSLYPEAKLGIGPAIEDGFYYDFDLESPLTPDDLGRIEEKMREIIARNIPFVREEVSKVRAGEIFKKEREDYKLELIEQIPGDKAVIYRTGEFVDLCKGPHLRTTGEVKFFKLTSVAGAYWRGKETGNTLQRVYGTAFAEAISLQGYLDNLQEARKRDHRKAGPSLDIFSFHEEAGAGLVFYHPKGGMLRHVLENFIKEEHLKRGYQLVSTPHILKSDIWDISGHSDYYRKLMFFVETENQKYAVKPMNCPGHIIIYRTRTRSYRDLPVRFFELGTVYRNEKSGVLHGLLRVRGFTQDDAHIFCHPSQFKDEIKKVVDFVIWIMKLFDFRWEMEVSTQPEDYIGRQEDWDTATASLKEVLEERGIAYEVNEKEGAFYGPKIDVKLKDSLGRTWQGATIQVDFALPERFKVSYIGEDGQKQRPVLIHRAILGTIERFLGILIEHLGGAFPLWLAPVQVKVLTVTERQADYAKKISVFLAEEGFRVEEDFRNEKIGFKIREAETQKVPYSLIIGKKEEESSTVAVRQRGKGDLGPRGIKEFSESARKLSQQKEMF